VPAVMEELVDYVCARLPVRSRIVGKDRIKSVVEDVVRKWPTNELCRYGDGVEEQREAIDRLGKEMRYGCPMIMLFFLSTIISLAFQWWLSRRANRLKMAGWQYALRGGS